MRRILISFLAVGLLVLGLPGSAAAEVIASVVNIVDTSGWLPPSPDAMGLTYDPSIERLVVVDSEVEETPLYDDVNGWIARTDGTITDTFVTIDPAYVSDMNPIGFYTDEPTDITRNPTTGHFFVSSDGPDRTFEIDPGADAKMGGGDDVVVGEIRHTLHGFAPFPAYDVEGIAFGDGALWMGVGDDIPLDQPDAEVAEIYRVLPGPDGQFSGSGKQQDNVVTHWDTGGVGQSDPEGVAYDPATGHLFIVSNALHSDIAEMTTDGVLVGIIEGSGLGIKSPSGLTFAPASGVGGGTGTHLYVADRGVDNDSNPDEKDGKIYELAIRERPPAPTGLTAASASDGIRLGWKESETPLFAGYNVYRSLTQVGGYAKVNSGLVITSDYLDTAAPIGTDLFYVVTTVDTYGGESLGSDAASVHRGTIALRGTSTANNGSRGATSLTIPRPSGTQNSDVLVAVIDVLAAAAITAPGWTLVQVTPDGATSGATLRQAVYHRVAAGEAQYVFTFASKQAATGAIAAYSGVGSVSTLSSESLNSSSKDIFAPSVAMGAGEAVVIGAFGIAAVGGIAPPTVMYERAEAAAPGKAKVSTELSDQVMFEFDLTGTRTARAVKAAPNIGQLVVLFPV